MGIVPTGTLPRQRKQRPTMGIFDKAKDMAGNADELIDTAKDAVAEHGDKLPGGVGDKAAEALDKADELKDKLPGN